MRDSRKAILSAISLLLCVCLLSYPLIVRSGHGKRLVSYTTLSGGHSLTLPDDTDFLFCGSSQCAMGFIPDIVDHYLGSHSYNISTQAIKWSARYELLKNILPKFPIKTVVLEVSYDSLTLKDAERLDGDLLLFQYYRSYLRLPYLIQNNAVKQYLQRIQDEYNLSMQTGFNVILSTLLHGSAVSNPVVDDCKESNRGYERYPSRSVLLTASEAAKLRASIPLDVNPLEENMRLLENCIALCREYGVEVLLVVVPVSDAFLWKHSGWNAFQGQLVQVSQEQDVPLMDLNLLRERFDLFQDGISFYNETHLSKTGAAVLSKTFAEMLLKYDMKNVPQSLFYESYDSLKELSPYQYSGNH